MDQPEQQLDFASITADIVSSYVANNSVHRADLPNVIAAVHAALQGIVAPKSAEPEKPQPAVSIRKSVTPDFLISLEDGKKYKSLKRHLRGLGLTPEQYRAKWELPIDYPMIAPNYAAKRSELAKSIGLGHLRRKAAPKAAVIADEKVATPVEGAKPKRGRPAKSKTIE
ncbi:MucR family transcriptional regulator (plasmid) [Microvirga ossetica]|uniref:MucR family transcriptional regulator n=1 Tax=Microvirga ossetica TaxID=1882682 RepID=A0A1B2ETJ2_9HYPH|nr:MucR family transcriptional regulator [Microvirga ossetica]ANY83298.1 MucR family transcriptional regulator [Microvirga ossetica]